MKQVIIARKDLGMSAGKLGAQISHASMAFLSHMIQEHTKSVVLHQYAAVETDSIGEQRACLYKHPDLMRMSTETFKKGDKYFFAKPADPTKPYGDMVYGEPEVQYQCQMTIETDLYEKWLGGIFTKVVCEAKNRNAIEKAIRIANELGLQEGKDYFLIKDCCLTELTPEEFDANGVGRTLTCIGFRPLPVEIANQISKKFQLLK